MSKEVQIAETLTVVLLNMTDLYFITENAKSILKQEQFNKKI